MSTGNMDAQSVREFEIVSLSACIRPQKGRPVPGAPPEHLAEDGVVCMCVEDLLAIGGRLGQTVTLVVAGPEEDGIEARMAALSVESRAGKSILGVAWPLTTVPRGFVAVPKIFYSALGLPYSESLPPRTAAPAKSLTPKKKRKSTGRRSEGDTLQTKQGKEDVSRPSFPRAFVELVPDELSTSAGKVLLRSEDALVDSVLLDLHDKFVGRMVARGCVMTTTYCGRPVSAQVSKIQTTAGRDLQRDDPEPTMARVTAETSFTLEEDDGTADTTPGVHGKLLKSGGVGGLESERARLRQLLWAAGIPGHAESGAEIPGPAQGIIRPRGALLHGPPGTGKTSLALASCATTDASIEVVNSAELMGSLFGESEKRVAKLFARASKRAPCVVILDEVDAICVKRDDIHASDATIRTTTALLQSMDNAARGVFVIGTTNRPHALDPAVRRAGRFDREIEVPVPSSRARKEILSTMMDKAQSGRVSVTDGDLEEIAQASHGFVGADLAALWREAATAALSRNAEDPVMTKEDLVVGLRATKPSALRDISVEVPHVDWSDVGGNEETKRRLREAVEWPLRRNSPDGLMAGLSPPRGILMFGPPGCSKTLLAKAVATGAGLNFISVKGPELLSKYVGDSEKAVRKTFSRARAVAPAIIFFDELDALAGARGRGGAEDRVLAQLLVEMDDLQVSDEKSVVVIAATNRPDMIDGALLRPGRMDSLIYVGLPDGKDREQIFRVHMRKQPAPDVDTRKLAERSEGYSGAEIAAVVREAALAAMEEDVENARQVFPRHYDVALERVRPRTTEEQIEFYRTYMRRARGVIIN